ncbi:ankyrin [Canariomyces notabilis]|uniref:Ankyrin n=1 Tax=Canariomyces notabilis TaxID=2074819 RepID=A0AAN6TBL1_9PEZI|nr:ankyrin [Canariomyces arenarius]
MGQNIEIVRLVLESDADPLGPSARRLTSLHLAAMTGNAAITDLLCDRLLTVHLGEDRGHAQPTTGIGDYPLHFAAAYTMTASFWTLERFQNLRAMNWTNFLGETPLHRAAAMSNSNAVRFMTRSDVMRLHWQLTNYVNATDNMGRTALWHAAAANSSHSIPALVRAGANIHLPDDLGLTPAHVASRDHNAEALEELLIRGAKVTCEAGALHLKPAHMAALNGSARCMALLMSKNAPLVSELDDGTPLNAFHFTLVNGNEACARVIWEYHESRKDLEFRGWSLCVVVDAEGPVLKWMGLEIDQRNWVVTEHPDQDRSQLSAASGRVPAYWIDPRFLERGLKSWSRNA